MQILYIREKNKNTFPPIFVEMPPPPPSPFHLLSFLWLLPPCSNVVFASSLSSLPLLGLLHTTYITPPIGAPSHYLHHSPYWDSFTLPTSLPLLGLLHTTYITPPYWGSFTLPTSLPPIGAPSHYLHHSPYWGSFTLPTSLPLLGLLHTTYITPPIGAPSHYLHHHLHSSLIKHTVW